MWRVSLFLLAALPFAEQYLLVQVAKGIGVLPSVLLVLVTGMVGTALARAEGVRVVREVQRSIAQGQPPAEGVIRSLLVFVGGALLVVPGLITDALGVLLLVPFTRNLVARFALGRIRAAIERGTVRVASTTVGGGRGAGGAPRPRSRGPIIDVEGETVDPPDEPPPRLPPRFEN